VLVGVDVVVHLADIWGQDAYRWWRRWPRRLGFGLIASFTVLTVDMLSMIRIQGKIMYTETAERP
jgi:hypothetical protein